jgi:hypothetical protein
VWVGRKTGTGCGEYNNVCQYTGIEYPKGADSLPPVVFQRLQDYRTLSGNQIRGGGGVKYMCGLL